MTSTSAQNNSSNNPSTQDQNLITLSVIRTDNQNVFPVEIEADETIENLKALIEVHVNIRMQEQFLLFKETTLDNRKRLTDYGIKDQDMVELKPMPPFNPNTPLAGVNIQSITAEELQGHIKNYAPLWDYVQKNQPDLLRAVLHPDPSLLDQFLAPLQKRMPRDFGTHYPPLSNREIAARQKLAHNPGDAESKKIVEEEEQKRLVEENMRNAVEHTPEAFGRVIMLYVDCSVNDCDMKGFIDSGAATSVIGKRYAQKCGIMNLLDKRFGGVARGVGQAKILGRVHLTQLKIGNSYFNLSVSVLDQDDMEFLIGLDFLRRHQCSIDLQENCLKIGNERARFLSEGELPKNAAGQMTPTTPGVANPFDRSTVGSQNQQQQQQQPTQSQQPQQQSAPSEESIKVLIEMGSSREQAIALLRQTNNNLQLAASILFGG